MINKRSTAHHSTTLVALTATALGLSLSLTGCAPGFFGDGMNMSNGNGSQNGDANSGTANSVDTMFTMMMIPHHEQAIEMVEMLLAKDGVDPRVVALGERIKAAQTPEIALMESWLKAWGLPSQAGMGGMEGMDHGGNGMMSDADMQTLERAVGAEASTIFLEQMIVHHEGAIKMAEPVIANGADADVVALAQRIVTSQRAEIAEMRALLASL
jgi:uncharacterized protein (DUF305 family)